MEMMLDGTLLTPPSPHCPPLSLLYAFIVLLKYDGSIFILSQWQLMGLFSCGPGEWWNSKQTFFLRGRWVLHHSDWGRRCHLCCVAITRGYGLQYSWPPPKHTGPVRSIVTSLFFLQRRFLWQHWLLFCSSFFFTFAQRLINHLNACLQVFVAVDQHLSVIDSLQ